MSTFKENLNEKKEEINTSIKSGFEKTKHFFKRLFRFFLVLLIFGGGAYLFWCNYTYSTGTRTGNLIKVSKKGYFLKTCEGQLNLGGFEGSGESGIVGNIWNFSVTKEAVHEELMMMKGERVTLYYNEINKAMPWQGDTNYFIFKVEKVE
jgi:hypothetical protein